MSEEMAISVRQPWASAIFNAADPKTVENRNWATSYRGRLWIQAAKTVDPDAPEPLARAAADAPRGFILGHVTLTDIVRDHPSAWAEPGAHHWVLTDPVLLDEPVPFPGRPGLFPVPVGPEGSRDPCQVVDTYRDSYGLASGPPSRAERPLPGTCQDRAVCPGQL
jgi:hypothetical protein